MASVGKPEAQEFKYLPALDGVRALSIFIVLLAHAGLGSVIPGGFGVTVFFFVSGYLITSLLLDEQRRNGEVSLTRFFVRRALRLMPAAIVYVVLAVIFMVVVHHSVVWREVGAALLYLSNYFALYEKFSPVGIAPSPLQILWSLAVEEHFYIIFAPAFVLMCRTAKRCFLLVALIAFAPFLIRAAHVFLNPTGDWSQGFGYTYLATEARIDSMGWGCLLAFVAYHCGVESLRRSLDRWHVIGFALAVILVSFVVRDVVFRETLRYSIQGAALYVMFGALIYGEKLALVKGVLGWGGMVWVGKLSYSLYLYHWIVLSAITLWLGFERLNWLWQVCYWMSAMVLSMSSYYFVERKFLAIRRRFGSNSA